MDSVDAYDILRFTIQTILWGSGPVMIVALIVGVMIAFFQALTQIQEMTLTFVPKIIAIFIALLVFLPIMGALMSAFMDGIFDRIVAA